MTPDLPLIERFAAGWQLEVLGGFHPAPNDPDLSGIGTLLMFGPKEPGFWSYANSQTEFNDNNPNPMDRWSSRALSAMASALGAATFFPFGGPPWLPFYQWALATGRCHRSPISLLVHDRAGLFVSFRGALGLSHHIELPPSPPSPCETCVSQPCRSICPVDALTSSAYDVAACKAEIGKSDRHPCRLGGCGVRRACPISEQYGRDERQSAFHMDHFLSNGT